MSETQWRSAEWGYQSRDIVMRMAWFEDKIAAFESRLNHSFAELQYVEGIDRRAVETKERLDNLEHKVIAKLDRILLQLDIVKNNPELVESVKQSIHNVVVSLKDNHNIDDGTEQIIEAWTV